MLNVIDALPDGLLSCDATDLHHLLPGPTLIHLDGERRPPLFISVLQHGNELTGWDAVRRLLHDHADKALPRALSLFIGNVEAARYGVRRLDEQPDYNRVWRGSGLPEHNMMAEIVAAMRERGLFAAIDVHNNSGINPHYACINSTEPRFLRMASMFSRIVVYFIRPETVMTMAFRELAPAITLECGQSGTGSGVEHARNYLEACLALDHVPDDPPDVGDIDLFHTVAQVKIAPECSIDFGIGESDVSFVDGLEQMNFRELQAGTPLATVRDDGWGCFDVRDEHGREVGGDFLSIENGAVRTARTLMPSMLTREVRAIRQDCLCYFMERYRLDQQG